MSDCEYPEFYREVRVKARRPHKCCETGRMIQPGEYYWRISAKWDGVCQWYAQSEAAYHFARWLARINGPYDDIDCIPFGGIAEHVLEVRDDELTAEWERVRRGEITRDTSPKPKEQVPCPKP